MATFHFELVSPDKLMFSGEAESVLVPGSEGDFVVLKDHAPVMAALKPGVIAIEDAAGKHKRIFVRGGFADVSQTGLIVLAETALPEGELDAARLDQEIRDTEEDLADAPDEQKRLWQEKLDRLRELKDALKLSSGAAGRPHHSPRHCERSKAIQGRKASPFAPWIASSLRASQWRGFFGRLTRLSPQRSHFRRQLFCRAL